MQHFADDSGIVCMTKERIEGGGCIQICESVDQMTAKAVSDTMEKMVQDGARWWNLLGKSLWYGDRGRSCP